MRRSVIRYGQNENNDVAPEHLVELRPAGHDGPEARSTTEAALRGGFGPNFGLLIGAQPVVLSPGVRAVSPDAGALLSAGDNPLRVDFDSVMAAKSSSGELAWTAAGFRATHQRSSSASRCTVRPRRPLGRVTTSSWTATAIRTSHQASNRTATTTSGARLQEAGANPGPSTTAGSSPTTAKSSAKATHYVVTFDGTSEGASNDASNENAKQQSASLGWHFVFITCDLDLAEIDQNGFARRRPSIFDLPLDRWERDRRTHLHFLA